MVLQVLHDTLHDLTLRAFEVKWCPIPKEINRNLVYINSKQRAKHTLLYTNLVFFIVLDAEVVPKLDVEVVPAAVGAAILQPDHGVPATAGHARHLGVMRAEP